MSSRKRELNVVIIKPSKYGENGFVERFRFGFMPNSTLPYIHSLVPDMIDDTAIRVHVIDEYVWTDAGYVDLLDSRKHGPTLLLLVGVQSHQFQRALDLAALAKKRGCMAVIGGPHPMSCETIELQGRGVSFSIAEADLVLLTIIHDAVQGELQPVYGTGQRWARELDPPVLRIPDQHGKRRHVTQLLGVYPVRGCPYTCTYCSVIQVAGRNIRFEPIDTTIATLRAAVAAGVKTVFFTADNFNKNPQVKALCEAIIEAKLGLRFFIQCDTQVVKQPQLIELFAKTGVFQIFLGIESLNPKALAQVHKTQNRPDTYDKIKQMCDAAGINTHFSMINGFPVDTYADVLRQLEAVIDIDPSIASFYTLCPIPGTDQYVEFKQNGLITANNLDRFDTTKLTWRHPNLSAQELDTLFRLCYRRFYSVNHARRYHPVGNQMRALDMLAYTAFAKFCSFTGDHPMSGGIGRRHVDHVREYLDLRRETFGYELVPLPNQLDLSAEDREYNRTAKVNPRAA